jgi:hypothetical protein
MKAIQKTNKRQMCGHHIYWLINQFTIDVIIHYWYQVLQKSYGFVASKKQQKIITVLLLKARTIPNDHLKLSTTIGGVALLRSRTRPNKV